MSMSSSPLTCRGCDGQRPFSSRRGLCGSPSRWQCWLGLFGATMTELVFLGYSQAELDRAFDQRAWAANAEAVLARCRAAGVTARASAPGLAEVRYGPGPDEVLDIFPAARG